MIKEQIAFLVEDGCILAENADKLLALAEADVDCTKEDTFDDEIYLNCLAVAAENGIATEHGRRTNACS